MVFYKSILCAVVTTQTLSHASEIEWHAIPYPVTGTVGSVLSSGVLIQSGKLILAENSGGQAETFDGINFAAGSISFGDSYTAYHQDSQVISKSGSWIGTKAPGDVTINNLTIGHQYRIQVLIFDGRDDVNIIGKTVEFDQKNLGQYSHSVKDITWGNGLLVTGTFVADSVSQTFTIETFSPNNGASQGAQMNALLVHEIDTENNRPMGTTTSDRADKSSTPQSASLIQIGGISFHLCP